MKLITEQRRQELIADCEYEIRHLKEHINRLSRHHVDFDLSKYESQLERQQVALASLTAVHLSEEASESLIAMVEHALDNRLCMGMDEGFKSFNPETEHDFVKEIRDFISCGAEFYTAPPVPVINVPEKKYGEHVYHGAIGAFNAGKSAGYNECIADIEQLNGPGE